MWTAYFLMHKTVYLPHRSYYQSSEPIGEYNLEDKVYAQSSIVHVKPIVTPPVVPLNDRFTLAGPLKEHIRAELGVGWWLGEIGHVWTGKDGKRCTVIIHSPEDGVKVRLRMVYGVLRPQEDSLNLRFRGAPLPSTVTTQSEGHSEMTSEIELNKGSNEVDLISALEPAHPDATDPRLVSDCFVSVTIEELSGGKEPLG
jgi:hypothetical protein